MYKREDLNEREDMTRDGVAHMASHSTRMYSRTSSHSQLNVHGVLVVTNVIVKVVSTQEANAE